MSPAQAVTAVLAAAGSGERLGAGGPKAFVPLAGRPLVEWALAAFRAAPSVGPIVLACPPGHEHELGDELRVVEGGTTRSQSVSNALAAVETELVAIHDAARPLLTPELVEGVIATLLADPEADGAIAAAPVTDTVKCAREAPSMGSMATGSRQEALAGGTKTPFSADMSEKGVFVVDSTLDRGSLWAAQTPQVFRVEALRRALALEPERVAAATDEAMLVEGAGGKVLIHPSSTENLKVTTPLDLRLAELLLAK